MTLERLRDLTILRCPQCGRFTTVLEAKMRLYRTGLCAWDGHRLEEFRPRQVGRAVEPKPEDAA